jgi:ubiquinone/menaquinone biosynthesis C-methylase UbiE
MEKQRRSCVEINRKHWDAIAKRSDPQKADYLRLIRDGHPYLEKIEPKIFPYLRKIQGKKIIIPQFGDALVLLACAKRGAIVTGVDLSREQIRLAKKGAKYCHVKATLIEADWQNLPESIPDNYYDLAVAECGIFIWIEDLDAWMKSTHRVLKTNGKMIVTDFHPFSLITERKQGRIVVKRSYFRQRHLINHLASDASEKNAPQSAEFLWKLSDIINATIEAGFQINRIEEFWVKQGTEDVSLIPTDFLIAATKK